MRLLLMRHAPAVPGVDVDRDRPLTTAAQAALAQPPAGLAEELAIVGQVVCSPFLRARQTAEGLLSHTRAEPASMLYSEALTPGAALGESVSLLESCAEARSLLVVTHQPLIGRLIPWLCDNPAAPALSPAPGELALIELDWPAAGLGRLLCWYRC